MKESVFRQKSLDKVSSPEDLNSYMRVTNPPVWFALSAIIILLIGAVIWAVFGTMEGTEPGVAVSEDGQTLCYICEDKVNSIQPGKEVKIDDKRYKIVSVVNAPSAAEMTLNDYAMHLGNFQSGQYIYPVQIDTQLPEGNYSCQFVTETISAISFLWN